MSEFSRRQSPPFGHTRPDPEEAHVRQTPVSVRRLLHRHAFGWKSQSAIPWMKEAVPKIKSVAFKDPMLAADGAAEANGTLDHKKTGRAISRRAGHPAATFGTSCSDAAGSASAARCSAIQFAIPSASGPIASKSEGSPMRSPTATHSPFTSTSSAGQRA